MTAALLALTLAITDPLGFPPVGAGVTAVTSLSAASALAAPPAAPAPAASSAPAAADAPALTLPASGPGLGALALPALALLALAAAALFFRRRRTQLPRLVQVLETTSLGPKRSLVVARLGGELLVIGASEAGLQLLAARPAAGLDGLEEPARLRPVPLELTAPPEAPAAAGLAGLSSLLGRLRGRAGTGPTPTPAFDALLAESAEDLELRRKLARGQGGSVR